MTAVELCVDVELQRRWLRWHWETHVDAGTAVYTARGCSWSKQRACSAGQRDLRLLREQFATPLNPPTPKESQ